MTRQDISAIVVVLFLLIAACQGPTRSNHHDLDWLTGTWVDAEAGHVEEWQVSAGNYLGKGYTIEGDDTLFTEYLRIAGHDSWTYYARVEEQNDGREIPFRLVNNDPDKLIFENMNHDFPNRIIYQKKSENSLEVTVSSATGERSFHLSMKKHTP